MQHSFNYKIENLAEKKLELVSKLVLNNQLRVNIVDRNTGCTGPEEKWLNRVKRKSEPTQMRSGCTRFRGIVAVPVRRDSAWTDFS